MLKYTVIVAVAYNLVSSCGCAQGVESLYHITDGKSKTYVEYHDIHIPKGGETNLAVLEGPGKVTYWYVTDNHDAFYPGLVLKIYWDGGKDPSVNVPLADFFGAMQEHPIDYQSAPIQIQHKSYMCYLPMPFSKQARFVLANDGGKDYDASIAYGIDYEQDRRYSAERSRFHCVWHRSNPVRDDAFPLKLQANQTGGKTSINSRHTILEVNGHGQYVGNFLQVFTRSKGWWGEGVTVFNVDGQTTVHSPGTEDEYGSCWGFGSTFAYPYCGYLQADGGSNRMYRWYLVNPVRFQKSLKVEIQNIYNFGPGSDDYTSVAYFYLDAAQNMPLQDFNERTAPSHAAVREK